LKNTNAILYRNCVKEEGYILISQAQQDRKFDCTGLFIRGDNQTGRVGQVWFSERNRIGSSRIKIGSSQFIYRLILDLRFILIGLHIIWFWVGLGRIWIELGQFDFFLNLGWIRIETRRVSGFLEFESYSATSIYYWRLICYLLFESNADLLSEVLFSFLEGEGQWHRQLPNSVLCCAWCIFDLWILFCVVHDASLIRTDTNRGTLYMAFLMHSSSLYVTAEALIIGSGYYLTFIFA
jgi:hypothetical protein